MTPTAAADLSYEDVFNPDTYGDGDPTTFGQPLDLFERLRTEAPVVQLHLEDPLLVDEVWCISRHADICAVTKNSELFVSNRNLPTITRFAPVHPTEKPGLLVQDGAKHRESRAIIGKAFRNTTVNRLESSFRGYAVDLVEAALDKGTFEFIDDIAHPLPMNAIGDVLGVPVEDRAKFFQWVDCFVSPYDPRVAAKFEHAFESLTAIWDYGLEIVARKRQEPGDDVFSMLSEMDIPDNEIQGHVAIFATGAAETTRAVLGHALHELMRDEAQMAWLRERADDIPATAIQEIMRVATPGFTLLRTAAADVEMHGQLIKEGDLVAPLFPSGSFDPDAIEEPRRFDLSRSPNDHLAFSRGPHMCIGKYVAAFEIKILLEELLQRTSDLQPAGPISYVRSNLTRGVYSLPVTATRT